MSYNNNYSDDYTMRCISAMWLWYAVRIVAAGAFVAAALRLF